MAEDKKLRRRPRSDGQRNREHLLNVAKTAFTAGEIDIPLDEVARRAGVGIGTLYRHFPNRDALIEAVYRVELDRLADAAPVLATQHPPVEALRAWMRLFVDYIAAKQVIAPALNGLVGGTSALYAQSGIVLQGAIDTLVAAAVASGDLNAEIEPLDLLRALAGVSNFSAGPGWETSAKRLVDILIAGSRAS
ncbi:MULTISPECIES: TetR/AcrR family transcriptional regulator [Gluconobacter]|uniref:TetR/AcrR family transcriptional regulator n=1 Tax=Gluconobacter TaxID=441 RepID=UPI001B8C8F5A|nr:TetR/AcrR family transcriptional regulator [Gluconobacter cerinus]MBS1023715.1 TetR/AcrR family transcriptional regulator [Gluconobacter cerinus]MBS1032235.1 TetR/AcrR family transcriptional regulator [Gluconobacter cerinus]MBS1045634.1 TetR/AcrR family transcriptional regulator [Gluconobacter cerinus]MBS1067681.1 TetR/AcrR family transcriptional regulator [Gluconobacter cerinus]